ncbi:hypothetical protein Pmar_PMAR010208 [Perkinsus marinus ATCC 50983]|uniref:J domain-containing protein n=1 Tax=Perkinsus marinus (strain ATCC 50983 / TXsc) TaxID=423536 RepID=C5K543_PERM5|nr:hypothetical protein Pmar_PMAR010208 [Perkinsus marinus ATCC 50983]EER20465.1 hypothetical protein Pmar_PMAR010208 [Perkinsus marinus ATCC 50983]|eukprot:XP_002788669.1 hypothetical protein Pmar_PMAR010208 [Perkinsus marinus ATCC 50983]
MTSDKPLAFPPIPLPGVLAYAAADPLRLCLKYHPDKGGAHATDQFHRIKIAYDTLSDPKQKVKALAGGTLIEAAKSPSNNSSSKWRKRSNDELLRSVSPPSDEAAMGDGNLESMSITKLKCIAKARAIDIATCIEKADIINAIRKGLEETSASGTAGGDEEKDEARPMGSSVAARGGAGDDDPTLHKEGNSSRIGQ